MLLIITYIIVTTRYSSVIWIQGEESWCIDSKSLSSIMKSIKDHQLKSI